MLGDHLREREQGSTTLGRRISNPSPRLPAIDDADIGDAANI
jgi:hypothetical protein